MPKDDIIEMRQSADGVYRPADAESTESERKRTKNRNAGRLYKTRPTTFLDGFAEGMRAIAFTQRRFDSFVRNLLRDDS